MKDCFRKIFLHTLGVSAERTQYFSPAANHDASKLIKARTLVFPFFTPLKMKISSIGSEAIQIQIDGEDYSIADIVHKELLGIRSVKFAGVAPPHPLIRTLTIQVHTDSADGSEVLTEALNNAQERTKEILEAVRNQFPDAVKPPQARPVTARPSSPSAGEPEKTEEKPEASQSQESSPQQTTSESADAQTATG
jgi:DNA-directed RNA polymerase subunit L